MPGELESFVLPLPILFHCSLPALFPHGSRHVFGKTCALDNSIWEARKNQARNQLSTLLEPRVGRIGPGLLHQMLQLRHPYPRLIPAQPGRNPFTCN